MKNGSVWRLAHIRLSYTWHAWSRCAVVTRQNLLVVLKLHFEQTELNECLRTSTTYKSINAYTFKFKLDKLFKVFFKPKFSDSAVLLFKMINPVSPNVIQACVISILDFANNYLTWSCGSMGHVTRDMRQNDWLSLN